MKRYYTEKEYRQLIKHMVILCDTRDQTNQDILKEFDKQKVRYKKKALKTGDYTLMLEACPELGFSYDTIFDELAIERKNSISEIASNISNASKDDDRIFKEFNRMINIERVYLLIEDDKVDDIWDKKYRSELNPDSLFRTLLTWQSRNNMHIYFVQKKNMAKMIFELCKNCLDSKILK